MATKMPEVPATAFKINLGTYIDKALQKPLVITTRRRPRVVVLGVEQYQQLEKMSLTKAYQLVQNAGRRNKKTEAEAMKMALEAQKDIRRKTSKEQYATSRT